MTDNLYEVDGWHVVLGTPLPLGDLIKNVYQGLKKWEPGLVLVNLGSNQTGHKTRIWIRPRKDSESFSFTFSETQEYARDSELSYLNDWNAVGVKLSASRKEIELLYKPRSWGR